MSYLLQTKFTKMTDKDFDGAKKSRVIFDEQGMWEEPKGFFGLSKNCKHWVSIQKVKDSLFSRRNGYKGIRVFGYSICLRLFGRDIL